MSGVDITLRSPQAYGLAHQALSAMEQAKVWPTPLNFELWLHYLGDPAGHLGQEIERILAAGDPFTEELSESLASVYLLRGRLSDEIRDAGAQLSRELSSVAAAIATAHKSQEAYGRTLSDAGANLDDAPDPEALKTVVERLTAATKKVQQVNASMEQRLHASTREVTKLREHLEQVRRDAMTDALTNLANRKAFDEHLSRMSAQAEETGRPLTLAVIDIDHFKRFNDTWGHQTGDQVLRYVASVMARISGAPRVAARYGGEEFSLLFPGDDYAVVAKALDGIREEIASRSLKRRSTNEDLGAVTISVGLAQRQPGESELSFMERADTALYASKRGGRNRITHAEPELSRAA